MSKISYRDIWHKIRCAFSRLTIGGDWAYSLPITTKKNLRWFWFDGFFSAGSDNILLAYLSVYILALGATRAQIGLMSSLSSISAAILLLPGAWLVERYSRRKLFTVIFGGGISRLMIFLMALLPFFIESPAIVWVAIIIAVARDAFAYLSFPGWMSLTGDIIPIDGRGRYFGSRNFAMAIVGMLTTIVIGELITRSSAPIGYQLAMGIAFLSGLAATYCFAQIVDPKGDVSFGNSNPMSLLSIWADLKTHSTILALFGTTFLWNLTLNIAGPFFTVYLVQNLDASATMVGLTSVATSITSMIFQRKIGALADRWGPRRVQLLSMLLIPILPTCWVFVNAAWQVILINLMSGVLWGAYSLASFNYLLALFPVEQRARYSALYQIVVTVALAGGAAIGSIAINSIGFIGIFIVSALGRLLAGIIFTRYVGNFGKHPLSVGTVG